MPPGPQRARVTSHTPLHHTVGTTGAVSLITLIRGSGAQHPKREGGTLDTGSNLTHALPPSDGEQEAGHQGHTKA